MITTKSFLTRASTNPTDKVCVDVPLLIRLSGEGNTLTMENYEAVVKKF